MVANAAVLNSTFDVDELLNLILSAVDPVVPHETANLILVDEDMEIIRVVRRKGSTVHEYADNSGGHFIPNNSPSFRTMVETGLPIVIPDVGNDPDWVEIIGTEWIKSYTAAPIAFERETIGFISLSSSTPNFYNDKHADRLQAFADQASIAIRNARLYKQAQELATLEERQRLARDIHDAVSQTIFSASILSETLPRLWVSDPDRVKEGLIELQRLTRGALAEMRTLLVELVPEALTNSDLGDLINQLADGTAGRSHLEITLEKQGKTTLPPDVQTTFFRVAQEQLH